MLRRIRRFFLPSRCRVRADRFLRSARQPGYPGRIRLEFTGRFSADSLCAGYPAPDTIPQTAWWIHVRGDEVACREGPVPAVVVYGRPERDGFRPEGSLYLGRRGSVPCYAGICGPESPAPEGWRFGRVRDLYCRVPDEELALSAYAVRMIAFDRDTRYCGRCGSLTRPHPAERAKLCPSCGKVTYPRLSPAIIVLIRQDDRILLARSPRFPDGMFGLVAGFVEPGENLEHALRREVKEETGLVVKNIRYFGSEPWPFPDSLMIGFTAEYAGGELVIDPREIEAAAWFDREHLPRIPDRISISRALIDRWIEEGAGGSSGSIAVPDRR